jgi:polyisoprenoid-binding protein YceI
LNVCIYSNKNIYWTFHAKQVKLYVEFNGIVKNPWGNEKAVFNIECKINRKEWGLNWNAALEAGGVLVGEEKMYSSISKYNWQNR